MTQYQLYNGDCLEVMPTLGTVDLVLADPPYGTTACKWDSIIPLDKMWDCIKGVTSKNTPIVMTASQPFTTSLIASNMQMFKYCWVYQKTKATNYLQAKRQVMKYHEDVCVFYSAQPQYNPVMVAGLAYTRKHGTHNNDVGGVYRKDTRQVGHLLENKGDRYPSSIMPALSNPSGRGQLHPTQKPVALMEYLIKTYTNEGDTVLDFTMGSGTTGVACANTGRSFIGIELDPDYFKIAQNRIAAAWEGVR
jgi:DNA modification methylase